MSVDQGIGKGLALDFQRPKITIIQGSILDAPCEIIVNPANSHGLMGGGVAGIIRRAAGKQVEDEAVSQAPIPVGKAILTSGGQTAFKGIIHAPTMPEPAMRIPLRNVRLATYAALTLAEQHSVRSLAFPGMGTGVGGINHRDSAMAMIQELSILLPKSLTHIILVDVDFRMIEAWGSTLA